MFAPPCPQPAATHAANSRIHPPIFRIISVFMPARLNAFRSNSTTISCCVNTFHCLVLILQLRYTFDGETSLSPVNMSFPLLLDCRSGFFSENESPHPERGIPPARGACASPVSPPRTRASKHLHGNSAAHRDQRKWNVSKQKWNLC